MEVIKLCKENLFLPDFVVSRADCVLCFFGVMKQIFVVSNLDDILRKAR